MKEINETVKNNSTEVYDLIENLPLNRLSILFHERSKSKGFWDEPREIGTKLMLIVSELSEALEADRNGKHANMEKYYKGIAYADIFETYIKDTFEDEIADAFIRLLDLCGYLNIDIEKHVFLKMKYNDLRPYKHGKLY